MPALSLRLSDELEHLLEEEANREGVPRSEVVRQAIKDYLAKREKERFIADLVSAAKALVENPAASREAGTMTHEAAGLDIETIDIAEGRSADAGWQEEKGERWWK